MKSVKIKGRSAMPEKNTATIEDKNEKTLKIVNLRIALEEAEIDPIVGLRRIPLVGNSSMMAGLLELQPCRKMTAHVHNEGIDLFHIIKGKGEIYIGLQEGRNVIWNNPTKIKKGDVFSVEPGVIHQLKNLSDKQNLTLIFICPMSHICNDVAPVDDFTPNQP